MSFFNGICVKDSALTGANAAGAKSLASVGQGQGGYRHPRVGQQRLRQYIAHLSGGQRAFVTIRRNEYVHLQSTS